MAKLKVTQWNADQLLARSAQILQDFGPQVAFQAEQELSKKEYQWPRERSDGTRIVTYRKNGTKVTTPRDIVDTGELMNSATAPVVLAGERGSRLQIKWTAPYSKAVQEGGYLIGSVRASYVARARDWIARTYKQLKTGGERPFLPYVLQRWKSLAKK